MEKQGFSAALMAWHALNARDLPWHGESDPYRIWLSEIMLQQTRTETVKRYYESFLRAFPDVFALARADEARVIKLWEGLGYYSRARHLHAAAKLVAGEYGGVFPTTVEELKRLPGVGEYVAGAVASIAFGRRVPALDGNQARVLARVFQVEKEIRTPAALYAEAMSLVPEDDPGEYNQALMGLGAMVCTPRHPKCDACPVRAFCRAEKTGEAEKLPVKPEKRCRRVETRAIALVFNGARVGVRQRADGLLNGLWEFPGFDGARAEADVEACLTEMGTRGRFVSRLGTAKHVFTHLEWHMTGYWYELEAGGEEMQFVTARELAELPMPTALKVYRDAALRLLEERTLKKKTMARREWSGIEERDYAEMALAAAGFQGRVGLMRMKRVDKPFFVPNPQGGQTPITHTGYSWLQIAPQGENVWATVMFDENGRFIESYFDITLKNHPLPQGKSWFIDLLLDYVLYPDGALIEYDRDELDAAREAGEILPEWHELAVRTGEKLKTFLAGRASRFIDFCAACRETLMAQMEGDRTT